MSEALIYVACAGFLISYFPLHVYNYVYIDSANKYFSINVTLFRFIRLFNVNSIKDKPGEMEINGKSKKIDLNVIRKQGYNIFNQLCIYKLVQLTDFGLKKDSNAYVALAQNAATMALYKFLKINGNWVKLRNYTIFNNEHGEVQYYLKAVAIINMLVVTKMLAIYLWGKLNELKN